MFVSLKTWHKVKQLESQIAAQEDALEKLAYQVQKLTGRLRARSMNGPSPCDDVAEDTAKDPGSAVTANGADRTAIREQLRHLAKQTGVRGVQ